MWYYVNLPKLRLVALAGLPPQPGRDAVRPIGGMLKRVFDIIASSLMLLALVPLFIIVAVSIYLTDGRPIFIGHRRVGYGEKLFSCLKFRSMVVDGDRVLADHLSVDLAAREEWESCRKLKVDPRVTPIGRILRRTSLDELPQLMNIIKGDMSVVGPRPIVEAEVEKFGPAIEDYFAARPGLTGLWQVSGRSETTYEYRVQLDSAYVRNWSFRSDIEIIFRTVPCVLKSEGSY